MVLGKANPVGVTSTVSFSGSGVIRFLAITAGTLTITARNGTVLLNALPVTAGQVVALDLFVGTDGGTITTGGGASGTAVIA